jgi:hypothetical protein
MKMPLAPKGKIHQKFAFEDMSDSNEGSEGSNKEKDVQENVVR